VESLWTQLKATGNRDDWYAGPHCGLTCAISTDFAVEVVPG
jgi:hypothetical protein